MSAEIIQLRDYQNPRDLERMRHMQSLEEQAANLMAAFALMGDSHIPFCDPNYDEKDPA